MHIPDGFLDTTTSVITWAASAGGVAYAVRRVSKELDERQVPLMERHGLETPFQAPLPA